MFCRRFSERFDVFLFIGSDPTVPDFEQLVLDPIGSTEDVAFSSLFSFSVWKNLNQAMQAFRYNWTFLQARSLASVNFHCSLQQENYFTRLMGNLFAKKPVGNTDTFTFWIYRVVLVFEKWLEALGFLPDAWMDRYVNFVRIRSYALCRLLTFSVGKVNALVRLS